MPDLLKLCTATAEERAAAEVFCADLLAMLGRPLPVGRLHDAVQRRGSAPDRIPVADMAVVVWAAGAGPERTLELYRARDPLSGETHWYTAPKDWAPPEGQGCMIEYEHARALHYGTGTYHDVLCTYLSELNRVHGSTDLPLNDATPAGVQ